jgi:hypothetical protein
MRYIVESRHTPEECLQALDEILAKGADTLGKFEWGCKSGDHTGYAFMEAANESQVRKLIPQFLSEKTRIVQVGKFTPQEIKSFHKAA